MSPSKPDDAVKHRQPWALALQGGGPLGAFTWGVLDRLLETDTIMPVALSGASAGAVNACVMATHWSAGGAPAARAALERVWRKVSQSQRFAPFGADFGTTAFDMMTRMFAPYPFNPIDRNPLRDILAGEIDFERLHDPGCPRVFVSATRVSDGTARIFDNDSIDLDVVLASASLPVLHQAVEIEGAYYWDGGYSSNPPLQPIADHFPGLPILLVELMPQRSDSALPRSAREITDRLSQIVFSRPLADELHLLAERPEPPHIERLTIGEPLDSHGSLEWSALTGLCEEGRGAAEAWLDGMGEAIRSSRHVG